MSKDFYTALRERRTYYSISSASNLTKTQIQTIVNDLVRHAPSAFNSQSSRVVLLFESHHHKLWNIVLHTLRTMIPEEKFQSTEEKINSFAAGFATILYFEDQEVIKGLQEQFPTYADKFADWSQQANGMLQFALWTALESEGLGASLQHYNPLIDEGVKEYWKLPASWRLIAQMPFGMPTAEPDAKTSQFVEDRVKSFC